MLMHGRVLRPTYIITLKQYIIFVVSICNGIDPPVELENNNELCDVELIEDTAMVNGEPPKGTDCR